MRSKWLRKGGTAGAVVVLGGFVLCLGPAAQAAPPESLAVFSTASSATPYGIVSRVPVETDGGFLFSKTSLQLGKSLSQAAGLTLGDLGDLFIVSSAPKGTITSMPSVVNAQDPPSAVAPREAHLTGGQYGGGDTGEVRNADLSARASDSPQASAAANGNSMSGPAFSSGISTSRSESVVAADGTVTTRAIATVQNVVIGPATSALTIGQVTSIATVTIPPGGKPVPTLQINMSGAELGGVPVTIDAHGISVNKSVALPADAMSQFSAAFNKMTSQGLTFTPFPASITTDDGGAKVSGAAMSFRYHAPDALPRPSDIGSDEEFRLGDVTAAATARSRTALPPPVSDATNGAAPAAGALPAATAPIAAPATSVDTAPAVLPAPTVSGSGSTLSVGAAPPTVGLNTTGTTAAEPELFALPARVSSPLPGEARDGYRYVLLAAVGLAAAVILLVRKRNL
ncbi:MAG TPA: hypothetical protein VHU88_10275 [Sporichthyaceae bacterium]|nr:hypothetical protein [Sporichthyaceae bacterium]